MFIFHSFVGSTAESKILSRNLTLNKNSFSYSVYLPGGPSPEGGWPVILFLHGSEEGGLDGQKQPLEGIGKALKTKPERYPAIVVIPQIPDDEGDKYDVIYWSKKLNQNVAMESLERTLNEFKNDINLKRIYLTGLSMGGNGVYELGALHADLFAALVPIAACQKPERIQVKNLNKLPIWIFHGKKDPLCPITDAEEIFEKLKTSGGDIQFKVYPDLGHNSWDATYSDEALIYWLFKQAKK
jgi:predicted peptidase